MPNDAEYDVRRVGRSLASDEDKRDLNALVEMNGFKCASKQWRTLSRYRNTVPSKPFPGRRERNRTVTLTERGSLITLFRPQGVRDIPDGRRQAGARQRGRSRNFRTIESGIIGRLGGGAL